MDKNPKDQTLEAKKKDVLKKALEAKHQLAQAKAEAAELNLRLADAGMDLISISGW